MSATGSEVSIQKIAHLHPPSRPGSSRPATSKSNRGITEYDPEDKGSPHHKYATIPESEPIISKPPSNSDYVKKENEAVVKPSRPGSHVASANPQTFFVGAPKPPTIYNIGEPNDPLEKDGRPGSGVSRNEVNASIASSERMRSGSVVVGTINN